MIFVHLQLISCLVLLELLHGNEMKCHCHSRLGQKVRLKVISFFFCQYSHLFQ